MFVYKQDNKIVTVDWKIIFEQATEVQSELIEPSGNLGTVA